MFSIDDSVNLSLAEMPDQKILTFNPTMQDFFRKWFNFVHEKEKPEILAIEDKDRKNLLNLPRKNGNYVWELR